jgi:hypothetical protein
MSFLCGKGSARAAGNDGVAGSWGGDTRVEASARSSARRISIARWWYVGDHVMSGYYAEPEATRAVMKTAGSTRGHGGLGC